MKHKASGTNGKVSAGIRNAPTAAFRSNVIISNLALRHTQVLGVLTTDTNNYACARIIEGAKAKARTYGCRVLLFDEVKQHSRHESSCSLSLDQCQIEGLFVVCYGASCDNCCVFEDWPRGFPIVTAGCVPNREDVVTISMTSYEGARQATEHLFGLGHRRIAHITGPLETRESQERRMGYTEALQKAYVAPEADLIASGDWSIASGYRATIELLGRSPGFTALFAQNDAMALGALCALHEHGLRVPEDVAIVGFDNLPSAQHGVPWLTTVLLPFHKVGQEGIRTLIDLIEGWPPPAGPIRLETELVIRHSCGAL